VARSSLSITPSSLGALNTYLSTRLVVSSKATISSTGVTVVFQTGGELVISSGADLTVSAPANFNFDTGGRVTLDGNLTVQSIFSANVDIVGKGAINVPAGLFHHLARSVNGPLLSIWGTALVESSTLTLAGVSGTGSLNVSSNLAVRSALGPVQLSKLTVYGGQVSTSTAEVSDTLSVSFGDLRIITSAEVGTFVFSGGSVSGETQSVRVNTQSLFLETPNDKIINSIIIATKKVTYNCPPASVLPVNGGQILVGF